MHRTERPMVTLPPWPQLDEEMVDAAAAVLRSGRVNYWTGDQGRSFEAEYAQHLGIRHALAVANGTVALELALRAVGVRPGDEVVVPSRTFIATASAVVAVGARPVCADVDRETQGLSVESVAEVITARTTAVVPVHLGGWPMAIRELCTWARGRGLRVVEDCAQAHDALVGGRHVGTFGDAGAFSFCQDKILTTAGEGGLVVTEDEVAFDKAWSYRDHGKSRDAVFQRQHPPGFRWLHESFGTNWRMTEVQAAVGRVALRRLPRWVEARREHAGLLSAALGDLPMVRVPHPTGGVQPSWYRWYAFLRPDALAPGWNRDRVVAAVTERGVPCFAGSCPEIYKEAAFPETWRPPAPFPVARELGETSIALLVHPTLSTSDVQRSAQALAEVLVTASTSVAGQGDASQCPRRVGQHSAPPSLD